MKSSSTKQVRVLIWLGLVWLPNLVWGQGLRVGPVQTTRLPVIEILLEARNPGLTLPPPDALTLVEDGQTTVTARSVRTFRDTGQGLALVLAVDISSSMSGAALKETKRALLYCLRQARAPDRIALVTFAGEMRVASGFGDSRDHLQVVVQNLQARGDTQLNRSLVKALALFEDTSLPWRKRLVVLSDGANNGPAYTPDDVIEKARVLGVPVDVVGLSGNSGLKNAELERLADKTGGLYSVTPGQEVQTVLQEGINRWAATPVATFEARHLTRPDGQEHRIGVRWRAGDVTLAGDTKALWPKYDLFAKRWFRVTGGVLATLLAASLGLLLWWRRRRKRRRLPTPTVPAEEIMPEPEQEPEFAPAASPLPQPAPAYSALPRTRPAPPLPRRQSRTQLHTDFPAPAEGRPCAFVQVTTGRQAGQRWPIETEQFWIGAEPGNQLCLAEDEQLSGFHALVRFHQGTLLLYDNQSTNGTWLNGARLTGETPRALGPGDQMQMGQSHFVLLEA